MGESRAIRLYLRCRVWVYLHSNFHCELRKTHVFWNRVRNGSSRSSKVVGFGTNRKRACDFLLVISSNLCPILPRFRDIAGFRRRATSIGDGVAPRSEDPEVIIRVINFELVQTICSLLTVHQRYRQTDRHTDRQTDGRLTIAIPRFALRESRGKNWTLLGTGTIWTQQLYPTE